MTTVRLLPTPAHSASLPRACRLLVGACLWLGAGCGQQTPPDHSGGTASLPSAAAPSPLTVTPAPIRFADATAASGIGFVHTDGSSGQRYLVEPLSSGVATFDYDGDGWIDIYFPNGAPLPGAEPTAGAPLPRHALYRNRGDGTFYDVSLAAGIDCHAYGLGVVAGDVDDDGDLDLVLTTFGPKLLYRNNGDGTFGDATATAGVADGEKVGAGAALLDADGDGDLDLYCTNYVRFTLDTHRVRMVKGFPAYAGPRDYPPWPDTFFRNEGDGTFVDTSASAGIAALAGPGMGVVCLDHDDDGDSDIYVGNDALEGNFLFQSDGRGGFREVALASGVAVNRFGAEIGSMGTEAGDIDNDGRIDLFVTDFQPDLPVLFCNLGGGIFEDVTAERGAGAGAWQFVTWGANIVDFDNDGLRDLFIACGHLNDNVESFDDTTTYRNHNILLRNTGGKFVDVSAAAGLHDVPRRSARGTAADDLDNDGDVDLVILNSREAPTVLRNLDRERGGTNHWLQVRLKGVHSNRDGVGARVTITAGELVLVDEVRAGRGYQGHSGTRLHFGLGDRDAVDQIAVRWPSGLRETFDATADGEVLLVEGTGRPPAGSRD